MRNRVSVMHGVNFNALERRRAEIYGGMTLTQLDRAVDLEAVQTAVGRDKKRRDGVVGFVLVEAPGTLVTGVPVPDAELRTALEELRA